MNTVNTKILESIIQYHNEQGNAFPSYIKLLASKISESDAKAYLQNENFDINNILKPLKLKSIVEHSRPMIIDEHVVDVFTAKLLLTTSDKLSTDNKKKFFNESIATMVALSYKMLTY